MKQIDVIYIDGKFETPHGRELLTLVDPVTEQDAAQVVLRRPRVEGCGCSCRAPCDRREVPRMQRAGRSRGVARTAAPAA